MNAFHTLTSLPLFGILLCLLAYVAACRIRRATGSVAANPFLIATILVVAVVADLPHPLPGLQPGRTGHQFLPLAHYRHLGPFRCTNTATCSTTT